MPGRMFAVLSPAEESLRIMSVLRMRTDPSEIPGTFTKIRFRGVPGIAASASSLPGLPVTETLKKFLIWLVGTVALSLRPDTGQELPALGFASLEGRTVQLAEFKGKPAVVNLWATWCPPCVREMPVLHQAQVDHPGVNFVFLNQAESAEKVSTWLLARKLVMRNVLLDTNRQTAAAFKQRALPTTLFFDARGRLVNTRIGELSSATLTERLQALSQ